MLHPGRFRTDRRGSMAIEFALVCLPFVMVLFGTIIIGLYYFTTFALENAVDRAARQIRTGEAQLVSKTKSQFKTDVCNYAPAFVDCINLLRVDVFEFGSFGSVNPPSCTDGSGNLIPDPADDTVQGAAEQVVLVTVCYEWKLGALLPFFRIGKMANGSALIRASTTFRTEPFI